MQGKPGGLGNAHIGQAWNRLIAEATMEELQAFFENPRIDDDFLSDLLERSKPWDTLNDERLVTIVAILGRNERMAHSDRKGSAREGCTGCGVGGLVLAALQEYLGDYGQRAPGLVQGLRGLSARVNFPVKPTVSPLMIEHCLPAWVLVEGF